VDARLCFGVAAASKVRTASGIKGAVELILFWSHCDYGHAKYQFVSIGC